MHTHTWLHAAPSPPVINAVTAIDSTSVRVEWSIPTNPNGILTFYTITYNIEDDDSRTVNIPYNGQLVSLLCMCTIIVCSPILYILFMYISHNLMTSLDYLLINWSQWPLLLLMEEEQVILVILWMVDPVKQVVCLI